MRNDKLFDGDMNLLKIDNFDRQDYLSKETTGCLKGIFAVVVLIHHLYQYSGIHINDIVDMLVQSMGYLAVGMFFFISGYGMFISVQKRDYLNRFWKKRFVPLYLFYVILIGLYLMWRMILGIHTSKIEFMQSFFFGGTIVVNAWYLQCIFIYYIIFYFIFSSLKENKIRLYMMALTTIGYCLMCISLKLSSTWYESIFCLLAGMMWAFEKEKLDEKLRIKSNSYLGIVLVLFGATYLAQFKLGTISKMLSAVLFSILVVLLSYFLKESKIIQNKITKYLGKYSLEIYVAQGFFLFIQKGNRFNLDAQCFISMVFIGTFVGAWFLHQIYYEINRLLKKF